MAWLQGDLFERAPAAAVHATFLIGPAGTGKTHRCLSEVAAELNRDPDGPPLLFIAPKQATFQLERQLLEQVSGYTRLQILSPERLAHFILDRIPGADSEILSDEGRVMVLRAVLTRNHSPLKTFRSTARLPGFAQKLSDVLREFQQSRVTPEALAAVAADLPPKSALARKVHDIALLFAAYRQWLDEKKLRDSDALLDLATSALESLKPALPADEAGVRFGGLWLDGFAEMTPQEIELIARLLPFCARATLAFCLDRCPDEEPSWLSTWSVIGQTFARLRRRLDAIPGCRCAIEFLDREDAGGRFAASPALAHIERHWTDPQPFSNGAASSPPEQSSGDALPVQIVSCATPQHEADFVAREILRHVRGGGRFRDVAVLLRSLETHHHALRRVFRRYGIPFFLDRRESVAHHPLAELTRFSIRTVAFGWKHEDWFGVLKSGFPAADDDEIDLLENTALAFGWEGERWLKPLSIRSEASLAEKLDDLRKRILPPFSEFASDVGVTGSSPGAAVTGALLANAMRSLWQRLRVAEQLDEWANGLEAADGAQSATDTRETRADSPHTSVWEQMNDWLDNLELAFSETALPLRDWLAIIEAGLSGLTVGVIPPALDQVLVGSVDRSRNPDLKVVFVAGFNEGIFPAPPIAPLLLSEDDRAELERRNCRLSVSQRARIGHERFYAYIACTRARERLVLTYATADGDGKSLNPSPFIAHIRRLLPSIEVAAHGATEPADAIHASELMAPLVRAVSLQPAWLTHFESAAPFDQVIAKARELLRSDARACLGAPAVAGLYGAELRTSVSNLEDFAACPFKFFVARGLRAQERAQFVVDPSQRGQFQHEVLKEFQERVRKSGRRWRELAPGDAAVLIAEIAEGLAPEFAGGLFRSPGSAAFTGQVLVENLQRFAETLVRWARQYEFEPAVAEFSFGLPDSTQQGWSIDLGDGRSLVLRGRIDRIDVWRDASRTAAISVVDYKSSPRRVEAIRLHAGLELQLLAYLGAARQLAELRNQIDAAEVIAAGAFYVSMRPEVTTHKTRDRALAEGAEKNGYQHRGRFDAEMIPQFDNRGEMKGDQFCYSIKNGGDLTARSEALPRSEFSRLLADVEAQLAAFGRRILEGEVRPAPYRKGAETACAHCEYRSICRFDPWLQPYRALQLAG